jgi:ribosomal protein S27AE
VSAAAGQRADNFCPKCGLLWFATRDVGDDLACIYCGWVDYGKSPDRGTPATKPPKCGRVVL